MFYIVSYKVKNVIKAETERNQKMSIKLTKWLRRKREKESGRVEIVVLDPPVSENDVQSFFMKLDAEERNVPAAMVNEWKLMAIERMKTVESAEAFAYEQGRLAAYGEMEKMFLETAEEMKKNGVQAMEEGEDYDA